MTLVVGAIDREHGSIHLGADSKITWEGEEGRTRRIYTEPALKIVLLEDDLAVGYAGNGHEHLASAVASMRGRTIDSVLTSLNSIGGGSFVVAQRGSARLWSVDDRNGIEDRTEIGRAWAGDREAYSKFQAHFDDFVGASVEFRLQTSLQRVIHLVQPAAVGGYAIFASAGQAGFRFRPGTSQLFPATVGKTAITDVSRNLDGTVNFKIRTSFAEPPVQLEVSPGTDTTPAALGLYLANIGMGYLYADGAPFDRIPIRADSLASFVETAHSQHHQSLSTPT